MTFDDDLIAAVQARAPQGVVFDRPEVIAALTQAMNQPPGIPMFTVGAVRRAAVAELVARRRRRDEAAMAVDN